jgi:hypothetical protein
MLKPVLLALIAIGWAAGTAAAGCRTLPDLTQKFVDIYPTGGQVARLTGDAAQAAMTRLGVGGKGVEIAFLYSGDGPVTGARGRYLFLVLDPGDCIAAQDWIDGETFDGAVAPD